MTLSPMRRRLVSTALKLYPRAWRERYGEELIDLVDARGITRRQAVALFAAALGERLRSDPRLDASVAGGIRRFIVAVVLAYSAAVSVWLLASMAWAGAGAVAYVYLWTEFDRFEPTFGSYLVQRWEFGWREVLLAVPAYLGFSVAFAFPVTAVLTFTPLSARWPVASRVTAVIAFLGFSIWLLPPVHAILFIPAAWCFALALFPSHRTDLPLAPGRVGGRS